MRGKLNEISIVGLMKVLHDGGQSGRLRLDGGDGSAEIFFAAGNITGFEIEGPTSRDGPYDVFRWQEGEFEFKIGDFTVYRPVKLDTKAFIAAGADYERRWYALARVPLTAQTFVAPVMPAPPPPPKRRNAATLAAVGAGNAVSALAEALGIGLLEAAERAYDLLKEGRVAAGGEVSPRLAAAAEELLRLTLKNYEIFAGRILVKKLTARLKDYGAGVNLSSTFGAEGAAAAGASTSAASAWRALFDFLVREMGGPVGAEVADLLWRRSLSSLSAPHAATLVRYGVGGAAAPAGGGDELES